MPPSRRRSAGWLVRACLLIAAISASAALAPFVAAERGDGGSTSEEENAVDDEATIAHAETHGEPTPEEIQTLAEAGEFDDPESPAETDPPPAAPAPRLGSVEEVVGHSRSISLGRAARGFLRHGVPLPPRAGVWLKPTARGQHFGTAELVTLVVHAATQVASAYPESQLVVGDLSRQGGGRLRPHRSHRSGRDVDLGFYLRDAAGERLDRAPAFVAMRASLRGVRRGVTYRFDVERNWAFVRALLEHPEIHPQYIFVARPMKRALLDHARDTGAPDAIRERAARVLDQPRGSPHWSHFHLRIFCPPNDRPGCVDDPPFYPWVRAETTGSETPEP